MRNSRFYNRRLRPDRDGRKPSVARLSKADDVLKEAELAWYGLHEVRKKAARSQMYAFEDQWGDYIIDPFSKRLMKESDYIKEQGKQPLKNNVIRPILKNMDGQFRNASSKPVCVVRDRKETKVGEMMSVAIEYCHQVNETKEIDASCLTNLMLSGICAQRVEYGFNPARQRLDVWTYPININRLFFNTDIEDPRGWDIRIVGEIYDMPLSDVVARFAPGDKDAIEAITNIYGDKSYVTWSDHNGLQGTQNKHMDFYLPSRDDLCRVILIWKKESREALFCHDMLTGEWWYESITAKSAIEMENRRRIEEGLANGVEMEDMLLIEHEFSIEQYWYFRYMTPFGDVLKEGRSPYWHKEHNFIINIYPFVNGKVFNFVDDFIDQQRYINRTLTMIDFIRSSSAKGLMIVDEDAFQGMSKEEIVDEYVRYNGVLFVRLKPGQNIQNIAQQFNGAAAVNGDFELLNLQLRLINEISGVNTAMQGQGAPSNTPSSLYAQQAQNSSLNVKGILESFRGFQKNRDNKMMRTIQQYYDSARYIDLAGSDYSKESKWYDPKKVQDSDMDVYITEGSNTPVYQMVMNDFLMELYKTQAINVKQLLENSSLPFSDRILESIKRDEEEMRQAAEQGRMAQPQGVPPELIPQAVA